MQLTSSQKRTERELHGGVGMLPQGKVRTHGGGGASSISPTLTAWVVRRVGDGLRCDPTFRVFRCPNGHGFEVARVRCSGDRFCPDCSKVWAGKEAIRAAQRLERVQDGGRAVRHVVVSWPAILRPLTRERLVQARKEAWRALRRMGATGGAIVVHGWRHAPSGVGIEWRPGLHVHALVFGRIDERARPAGVFVMTKRPKQESLIGTLAYLLDHAACMEGGHAITWVGSCSYNKAGADPKRTPDGPRCPVCNALMELLLPGVSRDGIDSFRELNPGERWLDG